MIQYIITPAMGKRLIGLGMAQHPQILRVLEAGTLVIIAGSTNGYVAEEILKKLGQAEGFSRYGFRRSLVTPIGAEVTEVHLHEDVVILNGEWQRGLTVFDVIDNLETGDVILKGANAFDAYGQAGVRVGSTSGGTILAALSAVIGKRVHLILPVGLEKRVLEDINMIARLVNSSDAKGPRLLPVSGELFTEIEAIQLLSEADAFMISAGGIYGAEGSVWLGIVGNQEEEQAASLLIESIAGEPLCEV